MTSLVANISLAWSFQKHQHVSRQRSYCEMMMMMMVYIEHVVLSDNRVLTHSNTKAINNRGHVWWVSYTGTWGTSENNVHVYKVSKVQCWCVYCQQKAQITTMHNVKCDVCKAADKRFNRLLTNCPASSCDPLPSGRTAPIQKQEVCNLQWKSHLRENRHIKC